MHWCTRLQAAPALRAAQAMRYISTRAGLGAFSQATSTGFSPEPAPLHQPVEKVHQLKTTVKLDNNRAVVVNSATGGAVPIDLATFGIAAFSVKLTPDQAAILGAALQEQAEIAERQGVQH